MLGIDFPRPTSGDVVAGISVALVVIPQGMANAALAGMPPYVGLYASALPLIVFAMFASSPYLQTGPVAMTSLLTFGVLTGAGFTVETTDYIAAGAVLAVIVGVVRVVLSLLRLGVVAYLICEPVMIGFTIGAAVVIMSSQLPKAFGVDAIVPESGGTLGQAAWAVTNPGMWQWEAVAIALFTIILMRGGRLLHRLFPGVLVGLVGALIYSTITDYGSSFERAAVGEIPQGLPSISFALPWDTLPSLLVGGLVIAFVGFAEPSAIARTFAKEDGLPWSATRELFSSGMANLTAAFSGGLPVGGSFARSSVNRFSGAKTRWSGGITGIILLAFLPFASILENLPNAVLGAVVLGAVLNLLNPVRLFRLWKPSWSQAMLAWLTFAATLLATPNIQWAIVFGIVLTVVHHFLFPVAIESRETAAELAPEPDARPVVDIQPTGLVWLGSSAAFERQLRDVATAHPNASLQMDLSRTPAVDNGMAEAVGRIAAEIEPHGRTITMTNAPIGAQDLIKSAIDDAIDQSLAPG